MSNQIIKNFTQAKYHRQNVENPRLADIDAVIKIDRQEAWLLDDGKTEAWVPKSLVENNNDGTFTMPEWLAQERGFI